MAVYLVEAFPRWLGHADPLLFRPRERFNGSLDLVEGKLEVTPAAASAIVPGRRIPSVMDDLLHQQRH